MNGFAFDSSQAWIVGFIIIGFSSYTRFNTPPTSRSSTTWLRYHAIAFIYAAVTVAGWLMLANTPDLLEYLGIQANLDKRVSELAVPLYAALVLTALVSSFKPFQMVDEKLRTFFHDLAHIPWEAQRLSAALLARTWLPTSLIQQQVSKRLRDDGFNEDDISFLDDDSPRALWTKISALHYHLNRWRDQRRFSGFYYQHLAEFQKLSDSYDMLSAAARRHFRILDSLRSMPGHPKLTEVQGELVQRFAVDARRLEKDICDLTSRALLKCTQSEKARREALEVMGFVVNVSPNPMFDRLLLLYVMLTALYIVVLWLAARPRAILTGAVIGTIYIGAVGSSIYLKQWSWARPTPAGRPIRGYVLSGVVAFGFTLVASFILGVLLTSNVTVAVKYLIERWWPWSFMAAFTAVATAYNLDNNDEWPRQRWIEAALQAVVAMIVALFVYMQLERLCSNVSVLDPNCAPPLVRVLLSATITGALIGWLVPTWFREPQTMTVNYKQYKIIVTAKASPSGNVAPMIKVIHSCDRGQRHSADVEGSLLPFEEDFLSVEEALAKAVEYARKHIDGDFEDTGPAQSRAA